MSTRRDETAELMELFSALRQFLAYGPSHWAVIAVFVLGAALLVWVGRRQSASQARRLARILGALTAAIYGSTLIYSLIPPTIDRSVPLRLTDLATVAAAYALWSQRHYSTSRGRDGQANALRSLHKCVVKSGNCGVMPLGGVTARSNRAA